MHKLTAFAVAALLLAMTACASQPQQKGWDKEGVRQRAGETGGKLNREEGR